MRGSNNCLSTVFSGVFRCFFPLFLLVVPSLVLPTLPLPSAPWLHVLGLAVDRAHRRIGLGARLVQSALQMAEQQHARAALLHVRVRLGEGCWEKSVVVIVK